MKNWNKIVISWVIALTGLMTSCTHDKDLQGCATADEPGTLTLTISVAGSETSALSSRAVLADESRVDDIVIWLFDSNYYCTRQYYFKASDQPLTEQNKWHSGAPFSINLRNVPALDEIEYYMVSTNTANYFRPLPKEEDVLGDHFETIQSYLTLKPASEADPITTTNPLSLAREDLFKKDNLNIALARTVARVNVKVVIDETYNPGLKSMLDLNNIKVKLTNLAELGIGSYDAYSPTHEIDCWEYKFGNVDPVYYSMTHNVTAGQGSGGTDMISPPFYIHQKGSFFKNLPAVAARLQIPYRNPATGVLEDNNYYDVKIYNPDLASDEMKYHIFPNRSYNLTLTVVGIGKEDIRAKVECEDWTVVNESVDLGSPFTLSNEEFVCYVDDGILMPVVKLSSDGTSQGTITATAGIELMNTSFAATTTAHFIEIKMKKGIQTGTITFTQDGVSKTVSVKRNPAIRPWISQINDFAHSRYTFLSAIDESIWRSYQVPSREIRFSSLVTTYDAADRGYKAKLNKPYFYLHPFRIGNGGWAMVLLKDVGDAGADSKFVQVFFQVENIVSFSYLPHFYTGAFWRSQQTAERLIQQWGTPYAGAWEVCICEGRGAEWAQLDASYDGTLPKNEATESSKVNGTTTYIRGTGKPKFRIGLRTANPNSATADYPNGKPRHGIALVRYTDAGVVKYAPIFLRQGEDADYVFAPDERFGLGVTGIYFRSVAKRVSPFALMKNANADNAKASGARNHSFMSYPTMVGTLFRTDLTRGVLPGVRPYTLDITNNDKIMLEGDLDPIGINIANNLYEVGPCPNGYTHLSDFDIKHDQFPKGRIFHTRYQTSAFPNVHSNPGNLEFSTLRHSLYSSPSVSGYIGGADAQPYRFHEDKLPEGSLYADGYFDRIDLKKNDFNVGYHTPTLNQKFAASGTVFFNPNTLHHVFIPGNGLIYFDTYNNYDGSEMRNVGRPTLLIAIGHDSMIRYFWYFYEANKGTTYDTSERYPYGSAEWIDANTKLYNRTVFPVRCAKD